MSYVVLSDVKDAAPQLFNSSSTAPPDSRVNQAIADIQRQIDAQLASIGYAVPVDPLASPQSFAIVKDIAVHGVINRLINTRSFGVSDPNQFGAVAALKYYTDRLRMLADSGSPFTLPDAPKRPDQTTESYASSYVGGSTVNDPSTIDTIIDRDTVF